MLQKIQNFFLKLQQSDEATKKRWLVILSSGSMIVVIGLWSIYINFTVKNLVEKESKNEGMEFFQTFKNGLMVISKESGLKLSKLIEELQAMTNKTNSITIQGANLNFVAKDLEDIKPSPLP